MRRAPRFPGVDDIPDTSLVVGHQKKLEHDWIRTKTRRQGMVAKAALIRSALTDPNCPFRHKLDRPVAELVVIARNHIMNNIMRGLVFVPSQGITGQRFRVWVSVVVDGQRKYAPTPWLVRQPGPMEEAITRAQQFARTWTQHGANLQTLQSLPHSMRYWKELPQPLPLSQRQ